MTMRIVVAEDEVLLREGLARLLQEAGHEVVGQAGTPDDAIRKVLGHRPDLLLVDIRMPPDRSDEGLQVAREIHRRMPEVAILVLSHHIEASFAVRLLEERTRSVGYLLKERVSDLDAFLESIRRVGDGGAVVDPRVVSALVARRRDPDPLAELSARERELLALMAEGLSNPAISRRLYLSPKTVETHVRSIFQKLGLLPGTDEERRVVAVLRYLQTA